MACTRRFQLQNEPAVALSEFWTLWMPHKDSSVQTFAQIPCILGDFNKPRQHFPGGKKIRNIERTKILDSHSCAWADTYLSWFVCLTFWRSAETHQHWKLKVTRKTIRVISAMKIHSRRCPLLMLYTWGLSGHVCPRFPGKSPLPCFCCFQCMQVPVTGQNRGTQRSI